MSIIMVNNFKNKSAIIVHEITKEGQPNIEIDTPVKLTGRAKICVGKTKRDAFIMVEVTPIIPIEGSSEFFIRGDNLMIG